MTDFQINDHILTKECDELAAEIVDEFAAELAEDETLADKLDEMMDRAHETADDHEWVIYNWKALMLCAHCSITTGEEWVDETGFQWVAGESTIYTVATAIAYGEIVSRVQTRINELVAEAAEKAAA